MSIYNLFGNYAANFTIIRTPVFPFNTFIRSYGTIVDEINQSKTSNTLKEIFHDKLIQEAVYLASPNLYSELKRFLDGTISKEKDLKKIQISLLKYYSRMSSRCTPFGLFAGYNIGGISPNQSTLNIFSSEKISKHIRLDMDYLCQFAEKVISIHDKKAFSFYTNSSTYKIGNKLRYIETSINKGIRKQDISHVNWNSLLPYILAFAKTEKKYKSILHYITDFGLEFNQAEQYLNQLIDAKILLNSIEANVTGQEYGQILLDKLRENKTTRNEFEILSSALDLLQSNNENSEVEIYKTIKSQLENFSEHIDESKLFQVDLLKHARYCNLDEKIIDKVKDACAVTAYLSSWEPQKDRLSLFKRNFEERYETAAVKLTDVLDAEIGINYQSLSIIKNSEALSQQYLDSNQIAFYKFYKFKEALKSGKEFVVLTDEEVYKFKKDVKIPESFAVMIRVFKWGDEDNFEFKYASGPSAARLIGRFCHSSHELLVKTRELLKEEEELNKEAIYAELIHIPEARMGNVISRPKLRDYEIQFLAQSVLPEENIISIDDLYLQLRMGRLILFSKSLNKEIIPRLTSAHNHALNNLQIYHFLADLQYQDTIPGISWNWDFLSTQEFLPRVYYKNIILSPQTWNLSATNFKSIADKDSKQFIAEFKETKKKLKIPKHILMIEADNELLLDTEFDDNILTLRKSLIKLKIVSLKECLFDKDNLAVHDENGNGYVNEMIIPFTKSSSNEVNTTKSIVTQFKVNTKRNFDIGSEWAYFKIYTGTSTAESLLRDVISKFANRLIKKKIIDKWFFIRYTDPKFHLRIRFHKIGGKIPFDITSELHKLLKPYLQSGEINDLSMHTYKREIERYGVQTIGLSEDYFFLNSKLVIAFLDIFRSRKISADQKVLIALKAVNNLISEFLFEFNDRATFVAFNRFLFSREFKLETTKSLKDSIQSGYRQSKSIISVILENENHLVWGFDHEINELLSQHSKDSKDLVKAIKLSIAKELNVNMNQVLSSYIHMFINRLFSKDNRFHEYIIYEYLDRYYMSVKGKSKSVVGV